MANKPKPPALRLLEGNRGKRAIPREVRDEVKATLATNGKLSATIGPAPDVLNENERAIWERVAADAFWLDASNRELLEAYCRMADRMRTDPKSLRTAALAVRSLAGELGLSATSRTRVYCGSGSKKTASDLPPELTNATAKPAGA